MDTNDDSQSAIASGAHNSPSGESMSSMEHSAGASHTGLDLISVQLARVEETLLDLPDLKPAELRRAVEAIVRSGGKRFRPSIALLVGAMLDANDDRLIDLASAVEMLHTATLVHDDLIDGSLVRRGTSTLNAVWTPAATVLTGDYLFAVAAGLAARTHNVRVISIFADTLGVIVAGELQQQFTVWAQRSTRDDYFRRIYAKTASMFVLAATAAGVLAGASESQAAALNDYGRDLGLAFQIMDDVLDFTGDEAAVGKPVGGDLRRGVITLPTIFYAESHARDELVECALQGNCEPSAYDELVRRIRNSSAMDSAMQEAGRIANHAKRALSIFPDNPHRATLLKLADYTLQRDK